MNPIQRFGAGLYDFFTGSGGTSRGTSASGELETGINRTVQVTQPTKSSTSALDKEIKNLEAELLRLQKAQASPVPPPINTAQIQSAARKQAQKNVNPYYNRLLTQFKQNQALKKTRAVEDKTRSLTNIDEALALALETSGITRERTGEDVEANLQEITAQDEFNQQTEGTEFDRARRALAGETAQAGLTTSGIGQQREAEAVSDRNILSKEEARRVNVQKQAQETFRTRTFQDLERADTQAKKSAEKGREEVQIDFDRYIQDLAYETKTGIQGLEETRQARLAQETKDLARQKTLNFIESISDPGARAAAYSAYGNLF